MSDDTHGNHPGDLEYVKIAVILGVVTGAEVAVIYISQLASLLVGILIVMMVVKFVLVALWFMHLRFDSKLFRRLFVMGIAFALVVFTIVVLTIGK